LARIGTSLQNRSCSSEGRCDERPVFLGRGNHFGDDEIMCEQTLCNLNGIEWLTSKSGNDACHKYVSNVLMC